MIIPTPGRKLAVIDTNFPWKQSGFRYWENYEIHRLRPDTVFFAMSPYTDPWGKHQPNDFPAPVQPISQLMPLTISENITDYYCVFLNIAVSLIGRTRLPNGQSIIGASQELNILPFIKERNIRLHTTLYPGGGLQPTTKVKLARLHEHYSTIFTNIEEVLTSYPHSIYVPGMINTDLYAYKPKPAVPPIKIVFAAHQGLRKNFPEMIEAFNQLDDSFHLHIIGDWQDYLHLLTNNNYTFHNLLEPEQAQRVYEQCHVFVSCSTSDWTAIDGFPTTAAGEAMSTGCLLVSRNSRQDRYVLESGVDYIEITDYRKLADILRWVKDNFHTSMQIATSGTNKIRSLYDSRVVVANKLRAMGLIDIIGTEVRENTYVTVGTSTDKSQSANTDAATNDHDAEAETKKKFWDVMNWKKLYDKIRRNDPPQQ